MGKVVPVLNQLSTTPEGAWESGFTDLGPSFWVSGELHAPAALPPGKEPPVPIV
jgi:hypothetical protein